MTGTQEKRALLSFPNGLSNGKRKVYTNFNMDSVSVPISRLEAAGLHKVTYAWENINVFGQAESTGGLASGLKCQKPKKSAPKQILHNVSGIVRPGEFLAIMGASGAGKTTLLNVLTFKNIANLKISGQRSLNGSMVKPDTLTRISAYVQQQDLFFGTLTVREHLRFQALLRMDKEVTYKQRMARVEEVIAELGLTKCGNTVIGTPGRVKGISGGEMKRLAFASEVLTNPPLMFCDEPTSGLDSYMAQNVVTVLKAMADKGKTVVCTIHQPSSEVFALFDRVLLMAEGRVAFLGPVEEALTFFETQGMPCPRNYNPADFYVHTLAVEPGLETESRAKIKAICDAFENSAENIKNTESIKETMKHSNGIANDISNDYKPKKSPYKANWFAQFRAVFWRSFLSVLREPRILLVKVFQTIVISGLIALIYQGQDISTKAGVMNLAGVIFVLLTNMTFQNVFGVVNVFCEELPIFFREHFGGMYRTDVYFLCKTLAELPVYIFFPFFFVAIIYFAVGLREDAASFFTAAAVLVVVANTATSYGYFMSCISPSVSFALAISPAFVIPLLIFGGFFLNSTSVPSYFIWLKYISWFYYGNEALSINQWSGLENIGCVTGRNGTDICSTGEDILEQFGFDPNAFWKDIGCLFALIVGFRLVAFLSLLSKTYTKK